MPGISALRSTVSEIHIDVYRNTADNLNAHDRRMDENTVICTRNKKRSSGENIQTIVTFSRRYGSHVRNDGWKNSNPRGHARRVSIPTKLKTGHHGREPRGQVNDSFRKELKSLRQSRRDSQAVLTVFSSLGRSWGVGSVWLCNNSLSCRPFILYTCLHRCYH